MRSTRLPLALVMTAGAVALAACSSTSAAAPKAAAPTPAASSPAAAPGTGSAATGSAGTSSPGGAFTTPVGQQYPAPDNAPLSVLGGSAQANGAPAGTGDLALASGGPVTVQVQAAAEQWVQLSAGSAGSLSPVVRNGAGLTLYRFDKDVPNSGTSACDGTCATTWPPVTVASGGKIFVDGVDPSQVSLLPRGNGAYQVALGGMPLYRFAKDTQAGSTLGQGVGGTWFASTPTGTPAGAGGASGAGAGSAPATGSSSGAGSSSGTGSAYGSGSSSGSGSSYGSGSSNGSGSSYGTGSSSGTGSVKHG